MLNTAHIYFVTIISSTFHVNHRIEQNFIIPSNEIFKSLTQIFAYFLAFAYTILKLLVSNTSKLFLVYFNDILQRRWECGEP